VRTGVLTRRQLLASSLALGIPISAATPFQQAAGRRLRLGVLQSQVPFIDPYDIAGSRQRALSAYRVLIRRSLSEHGPLDWLVGGALPLSGPGPFSERVLGQLALSEHCEEVRAFARITTAHHLRLTLDVWWRGIDGRVARRLLTFHESGHWHTGKHASIQVCEGVALHKTGRYSSLSLADLSDECRSHARHGVRIATLYGPAAPPGASPAFFNGSALLGPDGSLITQTRTQREACFVAELV
jgi:hypothetical protein